MEKHLEYSDKLRNFSSESEQNDSLVPSESILKLNDDCLLKIFEYLSLYDQIKLITISKRFSNVFLLQSKTNKKYQAQFHDNYSKQLPWLENNYLLELMKLIQIDELKIQKYLNGNDLIEILKQAKKITNLSHLHIEHNCITNCKLPNYENLSKLILRSCSVNDDLIKDLSVSQKNLKYLDLSNNKQLDGDYLKNFQQLETLILKHCTNIKEKNFIDCLKNNLNLKHINVEYCKYFRRNAFNELQSDLVSLSFCYNYQNQNINFINKIFPNLKLLEIGRADDTTTSITSNLQNIKSPNLEVMKISFVAKFEVRQFWSDLLTNTIIFENILHLILNLKIYLHELNELDWSNLKKISSLKSLKLELQPERKLYDVSTLNFNKIINFIQQAKFIEKIEINYQSTVENNDCCNIVNRPPKFLVLLFLEQLLVDDFKPAVIVKCLLYSRILQFLCKCSDTGNKKKILILTIYNDFKLNYADNFWFEVYEFIRKNQHNIQELHIKYYAHKNFNEFYYFLEKTFWTEIDTKIQIEIFSTKELLDKFMPTTIYKRAQSLFNIKAYDDLSYKPIDVIYFESNEKINDKMCTLKIS